MSLSHDSELTERVIGFAIEVHRHLGPGLLESAYEECLSFELAMKNFKLRDLRVSLLNYLLPPRQSLGRHMFI